MTQAQEPNDRGRSLDRQLRGFERRITRLEETQVTGKELAEGFDRLYDEIDALEEQLNKRFDKIESEVGEMRSELQNLNRKFDIVMNHITGQSSAD